MCIVRTVITACDHYHGSYSAAEFAAVREEVEIGKNGEKFDVLAVYGKNDKIGKIDRDMVEELRAILRCGSAQLISVFAVKSTLKNYDYLTMVLVLPLTLYNLLLQGMAVAFRGSEVILAAVNKVKDRLLAQPLNPSMTSFLQLGASSVPWNYVTPAAEPRTTAPSPTVHMVKRPRGSL